MESQNEFSSEPPMSKLRLCSVALWNVIDRLKIHRLRVLQDMY